MFVVVLPLCTWLFIMIPFWRQNRSKQKAATSQGRKEEAEERHATLTFRDVTYTVQREGQPNLQILKGVTGSLRAGTLTAVMGRRTSLLR